MRDSGIGNLSKSRNSVRFFCAALIRAYLPFWVKKEKGKTNELNKSNNIKQIANFLAISYLQILVIIFVRKNNQTRICSFCCCQTFFHVLKEGFEGEGESY